MNTTFTAALPSAMPPLLRNLDFTALLATKYLAGAALTFTLYDHFLTLDQEINLIWKGTFGLSKIVFFYNRYGTEIILLFVSYILGGMRGPINEDICHGFVVTVCVFTIVFTISVNCYMSLRHYALWDHGRGALIALIIANIVIYIPVLVLGGLSSREYAEAIKYTPILDTCILTRQPNFVKACWALIAAFDVFAILLSLANAMHRPHRHQSEVLNNLKRDGAISFVMLFALRLINLIINVVLNPTEVFLGTMVTLAMISITMSRFILRVEELRKPRLSTLRQWVPARNEFELDRWSVSW